MMSADEDALICDFAETYHIYDYRALPVKLRATLASGLREDSRIRMKLAGQVDLPGYLINATAADYLALLFHYFAAKKGQDRPTLFTEMMKEEYVEKRTKQRGYVNGAAFDAAWKRMVGGQ